jgi:hypothetical protein
MKITITFEPEQDDPPSMSSIGVWPLNSCIEGREIERVMVSLAPAAPAGDVPGKTVVAIMFHGDAFWL